MPTESEALTAPRRFPWLLLAAVLIPCVYLPTLATRFDFADDGVIVYPGPSMSLGQRLRHVWDLTIADFHNTGPFRPLTWAHWEAGASLLGPHDFARRAARLLWSILAAGALLCLLSELRLHPIASVLTTALAMWNPYRGEIWLGLGLTEAFAYPYALLGMICAIRAARASRPLPWDVAGALCLLASLGVKNTFVAIIPVQVFLRLTAGGLSLGEGWRRQGRHCFWYLAAMVLPITHFVLLKLDPRPNHYGTGLTWVQLGRMLKAVAGAMSWDLLAPGLALAALAVWLGRARNTAQPASFAAMPQSALPEWVRYRLAIQTGLALLVCGIGVYVPINGVAGRYTIPAVWGADLWLGVLLSALVSVPLLFWRRLAFGVLALGMLAVVVTNVGRQEKVAARNALLWQALEYLEQMARKETTVAWVGTAEVGVATPELPFSEGAHFQAHLLARGRSDMNVQPVARQVEKVLPDLALSGTSVPPGEGDFRLVHKFHTHYWAGRKSFHCYLWQRAGAKTSPTVLHVGR
jgi:hypothetical protein